MKQSWFGSLLRRRLRGSQPSSEDAQSIMSDKMEVTSIEREILIQDDLNLVDMAHIARDLRKQMGWPETGSVRKFEDGSPAIKLAIAKIEQHCGKLTRPEALRILAALDPEGPEADSLRWGSKKRSE